MAILHIRIYDRIMHAPLSGVVMSRRETYMVRILPDSVASRAFLTLILVRMRLDRAEQPGRLLGTDIIKLHVWALPPGSGLVMDLFTVRSWTTRHRHSSFLLKCGL